MCFPKLSLSLSENRFKVLDSFPVKYKARDGIVSQFQAKVVVVTKWACYIYTLTDLELQLINKDPTSKSTFEVSCSPVLM